MPPRSQRNNLFRVHIKWYKIDYLRIIKRKPKYDRAFHYPDDQWRVPGVDGIKKPLNFP